MPASTCIETAFRSFSSASFCDNSCLMWKGMTAGIATEIGPVFIPLVCSAALRCLLCSLEPSFESIFTESAVFWLSTSSVSTSATPPRNSVSLTVSGRLGYRSVLTPAFERKSSNEYRLKRSCSVVGEVLLMPSRKFSITCVYRSMTATPRSGSEWCWRRQCQLGYVNIETEKHTHGI